ncbi:hypothetical protein ACFO3O_10175 [Dokdonia ponticola]|uniref:Lipoprotein n=1 Tax=Dokdonia ponticola TaxID=2041041 RepID=A0ABV9HX13_9FLAO
MKKIFYSKLLLLSALLIMSCDKKKEDTATNSTTTSSASSTNTIDNAASKEIRKTETKPQEKTINVIINTTVKPPKYPDMDALMDHLLTRSNHPKAPLTEEQIDQINALADDIEITVFKDQTSWTKIKKQMVQHIKSEILTPEQLLLVSRRPKTN